MATQTGANVEEEWMKKRKGILSWTSGEKEYIKFAALCADKFWIMSDSKENLEQMLRDLTEEASRWDLVPKPASLRWTSTSDALERVDMILRTTAGCHKLSFKEMFKTLGYAMNRQGKSHDAIEERMQTANKAFWKDILMYKSKDVPWKVK